MDKIKWCINQKKGIELIEPNSNLAEAYLKKAAASLQSMRQVSDNDWKISTAYYTLYFSLYSVLMKTGVKCEIHSCTLEFMRQYLGMHFNDDEIDFFHQAFRARNDAQYYTDREVDEDIINRMQKEAPSMMIKCKSIIEQMREKDITNIRRKLKEIN